MHTNTARGAGITPRHLSRDTAFIQEDQLLRCGRPELVEEDFAPPAVLFGIALGGVERLFFRRRPNSRTTRHICVWLMATPVVRSSSRQTASAGHRPEPADHRHGVRFAATGPGTVERAADRHRSGEAEAGGACGPGDNSYPSPEPRAEAVAGKKTRGSPDWTKRTTSAWENVSAPN